MRKYLILAGLVLGLPACGLFEDDCGRGRPGTYYDVQGIDATIERQAFNSSPEIAAPNATVTSQELRLRLILRERYYTAVSVPGFGSAAYACTPAPAGWLGTSERADSLAITSVHPYDAAHPPGASLLDLLEANTLTSIRLPSPQSPQEPFRSLEFKLRTPPAAVGPQQFRIYYRQTNGEIYTAETVAITLLR